MYFVILFVLSWTAFFCFADRARMREMFGAVMYTCFLGLMTDLIMVHYQLWEYHGLKHPLFLIPLSLDFGIYPVVSYLFIQHLPRSWNEIFKRSIICSALAICLEWLTLTSGFMEHHMWWNLWWSYVADVLIFLSMAAVYRYYGSEFGAPVNPTGSKSL